MPRGESIQTIGRTVKILYAVAGAEDGRTVVQIAKQIGLKPNTTAKFVRTMEKESLLARREGPLRFILGHGIVELNHLESVRRLLALAGRKLISAQLSFPISNFSLLEAEGTECYSRLTVEAWRPGILVRQREFRQDPYSKASSLLFVAMATPPAREAFFRSHPFSPEGELIWGSRARLDAFLEEIRRKGYSQPDIQENGLFRVAAPIYSRDELPIAAVGAYFGLERSEREKKRLVRLCREAAETVSSLLKKEGRAE